MKQLRHVLALTLVFCMVFGMVTPSLAVSGEISVEEDYGIPVEEDGGIEIEVDDRSDYDIDEDREELSVLPKQDETADETNTTGKVDGYNYNIIHLDCGRKYFSVDSIKQIIDNAADAGFNYIQLAVGNDGMRFLLDDMNLTLDNGTKYDGTAITAAIKAANKAYYDAGTYNELTQSEMDEIIAYAYTKGMGVIPLINTPGHMDAILAAANKATGTDCSYNSSVRTIDVTNTTAVAFTKAFLTKYITYFAGKGCTLFNMGADEYANDKYKSGSMGFGNLQDSGKYGSFIEYVNSLAKIIKEDYGMTPMAFNDGIYFNNNTWSGTFDTSIIIEYWSNGWSGYTPRSASELAKDFAMVNTNGDYYWVLGKTDAQCDATKASGFDKTVFPGSNISDPDGSTFCIWSDYPGAETEASVISKTADTIEAFGGTLPTVDSVTNGGGTTDPAGETVEITLNVGESTTRTINGAAVTDTKVDDFAKVVAVDASVAGATTYAQATSIGSLGANEEGYYISYDGTHFMSYNGSDIVNSTSNPTKWNITKSGNQYIISTDYNGKTYYLVGKTSGLSLNTKQSNATKWNFNADYGFYYTTSNIFGTTYNYIYYYSGWYDEYWTVGDNNTNHGLPYTKTTTTAQPKTTVTITGKAPTADLTNGYTTAVVGGVTYNITVNAIEESKSLTVSSGNTAALNVPTLDTSIVGNTTTTYEVTSGSENITVNETNGTITAVTVTDDKTATVVAKVKNASDVVLATYTYNVTITKENLANVKPITVEYWITNGPVTGSDNAKSKKIAANTVYSEAGYEFADLVPANGRRASNDEVVFWKGTRLTSDNKQTATDGVDKTRSGDDFTYIRYWDKKWSFSADGVNWTDFNNDDQIVAYYLQKTNVTDEINTEVVDWGVIPHTNYTNSYNDYVLLDYAVRYQSGDRSPNSFPVSGKTQAFHCDSNDKTTVHYKDDEYYRQIGMVRAKQTSDYEVYMITLTPTSSTSTTYISSPTSYEYDYSSEEKVIWVDDVANLGDFADKSKWFTSISGAYTFNKDTGVGVGGDPIVPGIEIYNKHGMLVTYYIRVNEPETSLTVHYVDETINNEFYSYNIAVKGTTTFAENIGIDNPNADKPKIINNTVTNAVGKTETVNSDLKSMPQLSSYYRFSDFRLVRVVRSDDGKEVTLYYTFNNRHDFVVDFGVPLHLDPVDIGLTGGWNTAAINAQNQCFFGIPELIVGKGLTYTPNKVMTGVETIAIDLSDSTQQSSTPATHYIYLYPATNVLYEENVITNPGTEWTTTGTSAITATTTQTTEKLGEENLHGYDNYYSENTGFSGGSAYKAMLDASKTATEYGKPLTFEFTGNGFDLISECGPQTGALLVRVYKDGVLNHGFFVDTYFTGDNTGIINSAADVNGVLDYQVPVVRDINLEHGTYKVEVYGYMVNRNTTSTASLYSIDSAETYLEQALRDLGLDDDASLYEVSYMDENSVLNDNAVASDVVRSGVSVQSMANDVMAETDATQYVYVDGIRVYHTIDVAAEPEYTASEKGVTYYDIYDIAKKSGMTIGNYLVYVEGEGNRATLENYHNKGPQNEIYLTSGNTLAFKLNGYSENQINLKSIQISARAVTEEAAFVDNGKTIPIATNTEMYYSVQLLTTSDTKEYYLSIKCPKNTDGTNSMLSIGAIKLPNGVTIAEATESVKADVLRRAKAQDSDEFIPSSFTVNVAESVKAGKRFYLGAQTSIDVDKLIVEYQGVEYEITPDNAELVSRGVADVYTYSCGFKAPKRGVADSVSVTVKAHKAGTDDVYSTPVTYTVVVK